MPDPLPSAIATAHVVSRPDLVRIDAEGQPSEIATMVVNGKIFEDWESIKIYWAWAEPYAQFTFTCAEREAYPSPSQPEQFVPGDVCENLSGRDSGDRRSRSLPAQVAYDANQHAVQLQGVSMSWFADRSSIEHKDSDFSDQNFLQIAGSILAPTGVGYETVGEVDNTPLPMPAPSPGEKIAIKFLERLARDRKIIISNLPNGQYLFVGEHQWPADRRTDRRAENIKKMQCVITVEAAHSEYIIRAQKRGTDESHGKDASEQEARIKGIMTQAYSIQLTTIEHPVATPNEVITRALTEKMWNDDLTTINATVTVYGWFRPLPTSVASVANMQTGPQTGHTLWQAGDEVAVFSPMAILYDQPLKIKSVTWTQDNVGGTETVLNLVTPRGLNGMPIARNLAEANTKPAVTPPAATPPSTPADPPAMPPVTGARIPPRHQLLGCFDSPARRSADNSDNSA